MALCVQIAWYSLLVQAQPLFSGVAVWFAVCVSLDKFFGTHTARGIWLNTETVGIFMSLIFSPGKRSHVGKECNKSEMADWFLSWGYPMTWICSNLFIFFQHVELEVFPVVSITIIKVADAVVQRVRAFGTTRQAYVTFAVDQCESQ